MPILKKLKELFDEGKISLEVLIIIFIGLYELDC